MSVLKEETLVIPMPCVQTQTEVLLVGATMAILKVAVNVSVSRLMFSNIYICIYKLKLKRRLSNHKMELFIYLL